MKGVPIKTQFIYYGHTPDPQGLDRSKSGALKCQKCPAVAGTYEAGKVCPQAEMIHISVMRKEVNTLMTEFGGIKSGKKIRKKVSQMYKRDVKRLTRMEVDERLKALNDMVRPKPKWMPARAWRWLQAIVLRDQVSV